MTRGTWEVIERADGRETVTVSGKYLTVWKRLPNGTWKVAADIGNFDAKSPGPRRKGEKMTKETVRRVKCSLFVLAAAGLSLVLSGASPREVAIESIEGGAIFETVDHLSGPGYSGRLTGTEGYAAAADWIISQVRAAGLDPVDAHSDYLQPFTFTMRKIRNADLWLLPEEEGGKERKGVFFEDYMPMLQSAGGEVEAEVVFAGYGISSPGRNDYASIDVEGKVAMVLRGQPSEGVWRHYVSRRARMEAAREHGAAAFFLIDTAVLSASGPLPDGLPGCMVSKAFADAILSEKGFTVEQLGRSLKEGGVVSFPTGRKVRVSIRSGAPEEVRGLNVLALLPGSDPGLAGEAVILGAHLDHIGDWPELICGADDNASGSATLLEIARASARLPRRPMRSILFVWFGGEELGLLGSRHLAAHLPEEARSAVGVYNMDMVGAGTGLWVSAGKDYPAMMSRMEEARDRWFPDMAILGGKVRGEMRADHGPFIEAGVPAVSIFGMRGEHHGYHTPGDTVWWITPKVMEAAGRIVMDSALSLADAPKAEGSPPKTP